jgi:hypothetical protein
MRGTPQRPPDSNGELLEWEGIWLDHGPMARGLARQSRPPSALRRCRAHQAGWYKNPNPTFKPALATVTVPLDRWSRSYPRAAVAPAMGSLREANFTKDLTANGPGKSPTL